MSSFCFQFQAMSLPSNANVTHQECPLSCTHKIHLPLMDNTHPPHTPNKNAPSNVTHQKHLPLMHPTHQECNCKGKNVTFSVSTLSPVHYLSVPVDVYCLPCLCILSPLSMSIISLSVYNISPVYVYSLPCSCILFPCSCP